MIIFLKTFIGGCFLALFMNYHPLVYRGTHVSFAECNSRILQAVRLKSLDCAVLPQWLAGGILFSWAFSSRVALCISGGKPSCMRFNFQPGQPFTLDHCMDFLEDGAGRSGHFWVHLSLLWESLLAFVPSLLEWWTNTPFSVWRPVPTAFICLSLSLLWGQGVAWQCSLSVWNDYGQLLM